MECESLRFIVEQDGGKKKIKLWSRRSTGSNLQLNFFIKVLDINFSLIHVGK